MSANDDEIIHFLKTGGAQPTGALARRFGISPQGMRQRLEALRTQGLVAAHKQAGARGRPASLWSLAAAGHARYPDTHDQVVVELLDAVRAEFGEAGVDALIARRERAQRTRYETVLADSNDFAARVRRLADERSREGYVAEIVPDGPDAYLLIEHHCPICAAATACQGFCRAELNLFRMALGPEFTVERTQHLLAGDQRCVYRIARATETPHAMPESKTAPN